MRRYASYLLTLTAVAVMASPCLAQLEVKWSQRPESFSGENIPSDVDWRAIMDPNFPTPLPPNWVVADDFRSDGRPIVALRWWGSYFDPLHEPKENPTTGKNEPVIEDGFVISFFSDIPDPDGPGPDFSKPGDLLGSYITSDVLTQPTDLIGWDDHRIWEYQVALRNTHPDHLAPGLAKPEAFLEQEGVIYWVSIIAQNGHELDEVDWTFRDNDDPVLLEHYWGWHTSPDSFNDLAVMGDLVMPDSEWIYQNWNPIEAQHFNHDMAFELLTPEPSTMSLALLAIIGILFVRRRGQRLVL